MESKKKAKGRQQENNWRDIKKSKGRQQTNIRKEQQNHWRTIGIPQQNPKHQATGKVQESSGETKGKHKKSKGNIGRVREKIR